MLYRLSNIIFRNFSKNYKKPHQVWTRNIKKHQEDKYYLYIYNWGLLGIVFGLCYLSVPLYRLLCQEIGMESINDSKDYSKMKKKKKVFKNYNIEFQADIDANLDWEFEPEQKLVNVESGETALVFYRAKNNSSKPIIGVAVYTIIPEYVINYFSKVQCFCFNQQLINPGEELQLPLYFYLEPEIDDDPMTENITQVKVLYRFFETKQQNFAQLVNEENKKEYERQKFIRNKRIEKRKIENKDYQDLLEQQNIDDALYNN